MDLPDPYFLQFDRNAGCCLELGGYPKDQKIIYFSVRCECDFGVFGGVWDVQSNYIPCLCAGASSGNPGALS